MTSMKILCPKEPKIGRRRWYIPNFILKNQKFLCEICEEGNTTLERMEQGTNIQQEYQKFKCNITKTAKKYAGKIGNLINKQIKDLSQQAIQIKNLQDLSEEEKRNNINTIEAEIYNLERKKHIQKRRNLATKIKLEKEIIGKPWIDLNKPYKQKTTITALKNPNEPTEYTRSSRKMAKIARTYHQNIQMKDITLNQSLQERQNEIEEITGNLTSQLMEDNKKHLDEQISVKEILEVIKDIPNSSSPGLDGIPNKLWKILVEHTLQKIKGKPNVPKLEIGKILQKVYSDIESHGIHPEHPFYEGWLCPIYKKGEMTEISNYRPITVLNTDYRILSKILTKRLGKMAGDIIHPDQAGFIKERRITDQTELAKTMIKYAETFKENGAIISLDQEKAYDKICHNFLWESLKQLNFPPKFINLIKNLYKEAKTKIILNGTISKPINIMRGDRQGDPLSCLLFNTAIESLAQMIRKSNLQGFKIPNANQERLIAALFADDTTIYLSREDKFVDLEKILQKWCKASGAKFNLTKTNILPIGTKEHQQIVIRTRKLNPLHKLIPNNIPIINDNEQIRILGCFIGNNNNSEAIWTPVRATLSD